MWVIAVRKSDWVFWIFDLSLSRNHEVWNSRESRSTDLSLWKIEFSNVKYDDEEECCDKKNECSEWECFFHWIWYHLYHNSYQDQNESTLSS